jgi:mRNA-degrading endonuclease toxin of MazEF toxin-antitoxin module
VTPTRIELGSVVWAELQDANGVSKVRPAVVVSGTADIASGGPVRVVAITTRLSHPLPADHVLLPWDRQGKARSGLGRKCAAVASWEAELPIGDVRQVVGILPPVVTRELLAKVAAALPPPPPPADPGSTGRDGTSINPPTAPEP